MITKSRKTITATIAILVMTFGIIGYFLFFYSPYTGSDAQDSSETTSTEPTAQSDFTDGEER